MPYLDNAATTFPKPQRVNDLLRTIAEQGVVSPGRGSHRPAAYVSDAVSKVRRNLARFFGGLDDRRLVFCYSATDALNLAIKGFLEKGAHVIISSMEHNSVLRPLRRLEGDDLITVDIAQCDQQGLLDPEEVLRLFNKKTKLVIVSHASNVTGTVQAVREIGRKVRECDAYLLVDAAQTAGILPIDINEMLIDMLAFTGHKGLYGLQGSGGLVIGERIRQLRSYREGGTGINSVSEIQPFEWPEAFEAGTPNVPGILSMGEGMEFIESEGIDAIRRKGSEQIGYLWKELSAMDKVELYGPSPGEGRISVLSFNIQSWDADDVGSILNHNHDIYVRTGLHCSPLAHMTIGTHPGGAVRLSPGYFTKQEELEAVVEAIRAMTVILVPY